MAEVVARRGVMASPPFSRPGKTTQGSQMASSDLFQQVGGQAASPLVLGESARPEEARTGFVSHLVFLLPCSPSVWRRWLVGCPLLLTWLAPTPLEVPAASKGPLWWGISLLALLGPRGLPHTCGMALRRILEYNFEGLWGQELRSI